MPLRLLDPELTALVPLTPSAPLILVDCPDCQGESECKTCGSSGQIEVCGACLERPEVVCGVEACACTFPGPFGLCENCTTRPAVHDCLCSVCLLEAYRKTLEEDPEGLKRYQDLRDRELTPKEVSAEVAWAQSEGVNWL